MDANIKLSKFFDEMRLSRSLRPATEVVDAVEIIEAVEVPDT